MVTLAQQWLPRENDFWTSSECCLSSQMWENSLSAYICCWPISLCRKKWGIGTSIFSDNREWERRSECGWKKCIGALGVRWAKECQFVFRVKEQKQHEKGEGTDRNSGKIPTAQNPRMTFSVRPRKESGAKDGAKYWNNYAWKNLRSIENSVVTTVFPI